MGLDQRLYLTTKVLHEVKIAFQKKANEYSRRALELEATEKWKNFVASLPINRFGIIDTENFSKEEKKKIGVFKRHLRKIAKDIGIELTRCYRPKFTCNLTDDKMDECIGEWRKNWELHKFIVDNFLENKKHDNLVDIYLTKEDCEKIVSAGFVGGFQNALDRLDDEHEVFYWAWY